MADAVTTLACLKAGMAQFVAERDWQRFHSPKNLVMGLAIEAAELMEHFLWLTPQAADELAGDAALLSEVADEMADVAGYLFALCNTLHIDLSDAIAKKMVKNAQKYPAEQFRGKYRL